MTPRVILIFLILIVSCETNTTKWKTLDYGVFNLNAPPGWKKFNQQGIDSYIGGLTNGKDSLWFDYGRYSGELNDDGISNHLYGQDTINGLIATIQIPKVDGKGYIRLIIPHINEQDGISFKGHNIIGTDTILKIFRSLTFNESNTSQTSNSTFKIFKEYPVGSGQVLFKNNCAGCHSVTKNLVGPPLNEVIQQRTHDWIFKFLKDRKTLLIDSLRIKKLNKSGEMQCITFPELTKSDIEQIINYVSLSDELRRATRALQNTGDSISH